MSEEENEVWSELAENRCVIEDFEEYIQSCGNLSTSTLKKAIGYLFTYEDSLLDFLSKSDKTFNLKRLLSPEKENFIYLPDPTSVGGWFQSIEGPGRCKEVLKAHALFREYLKERLKQKDFGSATDNHKKRERLLKNLENIAVTIKNKKLFQKLQKLEEEQRREKQLVKDPFNPSSAH